MAGEGIIEAPIRIGVPFGGTTGQALVGVTGAAPAWSSSPSVLGTVTAKPSGTAGIRLDPNAATGDFTLSLSPKNLTANRRVQFPDADFDLGSGTTGQALVGVTGAAPAWSSSPSVLGTVTAKPSGTAGIRLDPNAATGDFVLSLSPKNLTAARRASFPDRDLDLSPLYSDGTNLGLGVTPTAGNGLVQLASGTTKANGIAFGTDAFLFRHAAGSIRVEGVFNFGSTSSAIGTPSSRGTGARIVHYDDGGSSFWSHLGAGLGMVEVAVSNAGLSACVWGWYAAGTYSGASAKVATLDGNGILDLAGGSRAIRMNGTQVLSNRRTGWTAQTATASRTDLGSSPTTGALASFCRALYDDLVAHGIIGT